MINSDRNLDKSRKADYFYREFNRLDFTWGYDHVEVRSQKPDRFDELIVITEK